MVKDLVTLPASSYEIKLFQSPDPAEYERNTVSLPSSGDQIWENLNGIRSLFPYLRLIFVLQRGSQSLREIFDGVQSDLESPQFEGGLDLGLEPGVHHFSKGQFVPRGLYLPLLSYGLFYNTWGQQNFISTKLFRPASSRSFPRFLTGADLAEKTRFRDNGILLFVRL